MSLYKIDDARRLVSCAHAVIYYDVSGKAPVLRCVKCQVIWHRAVRP